jgi:hypothetical protein
VSDVLVETALRDLAAHVVFPEAPDVTAAVRRRIDPAAGAGRPSGVGGSVAGGSPGVDALGARRLGGRRSRRPVAVAAAVLAVAAVVTASIPRARHAVADRLGLRGVDVRVVPTAPTDSGGSGPDPDTTAPRPAPAELGRPTTLAQAAAGWEAPLLVPPEPPTGVFVDDATHEVHLVLDGGVLLSQFPNARPIYEKLIDAGATLATVSLEGERALWISGPAHIVVRREVPVDGEGDVVELDTRRAGNTLVWEHGDVTVRIEGLATLDEALALARSLRPAS